MRSGKKLERGAARAPSPRAPSPRAPSPRALGFRMPAEWEPHAATWIAWPHERSDWPGKFKTIAWTFAELARVIHYGERVRILVADAAAERQAKALLASSGVDVARIDFFRVPTNRSWTRDYLPLFVTRAGRELGAVKWRFDGWSRYKNFQKDNAAGLAVARRMGVKTFLPEAPASTGTKKRGDRVVLEGGAIDVDGEGTLLTTEECLLTGPHARNRELGRARVEQLLGDYLGIDRVLWMPSGIAGDDTSGHVDDFVRFVRPGVVVLCDEPNVRDANHRPLHKARERLEGARDAQGRRIELVPLPMPSPVYFDGQRLPASYANFYVASHAVLVPTFNDAADRSALGILGELFPDRDVIGVYARDLVLGLGTLHCSTQQEPAVGAALSRRPRASKRA
jgi:agmatine deiminase